MTNAANVGALSDTSTASTADGRSLRGSLGVGSIVFMVVAAAAPLTVVGGGVPIAFLLGNGAGVPTMFLVSAVVLLLFSVGLSTMARYIPRPGAFFTYVGYGLGRPLGLGTAYLALLTYTMIQAAVYGYIGGSIQSAIVELGGPSIPWWVWSLAVVAITGILGYRDIELSSKVLGVLLIAEIGIVLLMNIAIIIKGGDSGLSATSFTPNAVFSGSPGIGLMFAVAGFIGFEATAIFRSEARDPDRTIPRATYAAVILIGVFYTFSSWALVEAWGPDNVVAAAAKDPANMIMTTAENYLGGWAAVTVHILLLTSLFACILSFHNVVTRYQHSMASATALPSKLGSVHPRHMSPHISSLVQTITAAALVVIFAAAQLDPELQVFSWFSGVATLGIVVLMALTCLAVLTYFRVHSIKLNAWTGIIAPGLGMIGLVGILYMVVSNFTTLIGGSSTLAYIFIAMVVASVVIGVVQALSIRKRNPEGYAELTDAISAS
ncbi:APC family permease [Gordonia jinhuaensis]|uniref:Amino acid transporter n=1 Tax=Gordonia jinhuaensis TaxID=1517702 RepID=A0A916THN6_9ACTN|nr:APC family permease [Gordonia jinhuaensis]GGB45373.1 amino acid transporter [Gordonia jinhuaensis]